MLSDPEKREKYDRFGAAWNRHQQAGADSGFDWGPWAQGGGRPGVQYTYTTAEDLEDIFGGTGFSDFFETLFGGGQRGARPGSIPGAGARRALKGHDVEHPIRITLAEAYRGTKRVLSKDGRRLEVDIPPGVKTGSRVRLSGEGAPSMGGGGSGDLYLVVEVEPDPRFERRGPDLYTDVDIPLTTAVLGGEATVHAIDGNVELTIPPETQNGRRFRLRGKGMPQLKNPKQHGDLYARAEVRLPTDLTDEERHLFEELRRLRGES